MLFQPNRLSYIFLWWLPIVTKSYANDHISRVIWPKVFVAKGLWHDYDRVHGGFLCGQCMLKNGYSNSDYWTRSYALWHWRCCFFNGVAKLNHQLLYAQTVLSKPMRMRVRFEIAGRLLYMLAIYLQSHLLGTPVYCLV